MTNIKAHIHPAALHRPRIHPVIPERASKVPEALEVAHFVACGLGIAPGAELGDEGAVSGAVQGVQEGGGEGVEKDMALWSFVPRHRAFQYCASEGRIGEFGWPS